MLRAGVVESSRVALKRGRRRAMRMVKRFIAGVDWGEWIDVEVARCKACTRLST